jgi:hypothetical protein
MPRDYGELLERAQDLEEYTGYLDTIGRNEQMQARSRFDDARRRFVYALFKEDIPKPEVLPSVLADLDRLEAANTYLGAALSTVREALVRHIHKQARNNPVQRFLIRWGPPALTLAAAAAYLYFQSLRG